MKNKNGFTLIELLGVIALLGVVALIAVPSVIGVKNAINNKMLNTKIEVIEAAAVQYGEQFKPTLTSSEKKYDGNKCINRDINDLVTNKFLDKDIEGCSLNECIVNPVDDSFLDQKKVIIFIKNNRIQAKVDMDNDLTCS